MSFKKNDKMAFQISGSKGCTVGKLLWLQNLICIVCSWLPYLATHIFLSVTLVWKTSEQEVNVNTLHLSGFRCSHYLLLPPKLSWLIWSRFRGTAFCIFVIVNKNDGTACLPFPLSVTSLMIDCFSLSNSLSEFLIAVLSLMAQFPIDFCSARHSSTCWL